MTLKKSSFYALFGKDVAELSGGYYRKGNHDTIEDQNRSRYNTRSGTLGMGFVQALLAVLSSHVISFDWKEQGQAGVAIIKSSSGKGMYTLSWDERDPAAPCYGNFQNHATYQLAILGLITCLLDQYVRGGSIQSQEVAERWYDLVDVMRQEYGSAFSKRGWSEAVVKQACQNPAVQPHIQRVGDAMWFAMNYQIVQPPPTPSDPYPVPELRKRDLWLDDSDHVVPFPLLSPDGQSDGTDLFLRPPSLTLMRWNAPASSTLVESETVRRIASILDDGRGPLMLVGPHSTGKSVIPLQLAIERGWGVELIVLDEGWEAVDLVGSPSLEQGGASRFHPGPLYRWAQRVLTSLAEGKGQVMVLVIDEFTRGHKTVRSPVMKLMNQYTAEQVRVQGLAVPAGEEGPFHILEVRDTQERFVLPARLLRIVVGCNWGGSYLTEVSLEDPALRSRFRGGWVHVSEYEDKQAASILARNLQQIAPGITAKAELLWRILDVRRTIREDKNLSVMLLSHLDQRTMLSWAEAVIQRTRRSSRVDRSALQQAFLTAARDTWIDMFCPMNGVELDGGVKNGLINKVEEQGRKLSAIDSQAGL